MSSKFDNIIEAFLSKGVLKAMGNGASEIKAICPKCGYVMIKFPGKYPACPLCKTRFLNNPNPVTNQDNGELAEVPDETIERDED